MYFNLKYLLVLLFSLIINISVAEEIRDYYAEPGLNPFKETMQDLTESIDPFSGTMQHKYTDMVIPGNGGLDIRINRSYTSPQHLNAPGTASAYGVGWTIHFGRIVTTQSNADKLCAQGLFSVSTKDNPSLELPDGGRELLVLRDPTIFPELNANELITRSNWIAKCGVSGGLDVTDPTGTVYTMNAYAPVVNGSNIEPSWFTSRIEDINGNWIAISYIDRAATSGYKMIDEITTSDGRLVKFNYVYPTDDLARLDTIVANGQTWTYNYVSVDGWGAYQLIEVTRPDNTRWQYEYNSSTAPLGRYAMNKVTYPQGGIAEYTYDHVIFSPGINQTITTVVSTKTTRGTDVTPGTWTYSYLPGGYTITDPDTGATQDLDVTRVTTPTAQKVYYHYGELAYAPVWATGLLAQQATYNVTGSTLLDAVTNHWGGRKISNENYWHGRTKLDIYTHTPILLSSEHWQGMTNYITTYNNYDRFGNPAQIVESGNVEVRTTDYSYYTDPLNWIISNKVTSETIQGIGTITREFNANGSLKSESKYGVLTEYTYHQTGDLATVTDARGKALGYTTQFKDYYRGIAREEIHPVSPTKSITTRKAVNSTGTVRNITNGRGFTKNFTYDSLNRLKTITYPKAGSAPVNINYTARSKTLTRGNLEQSSTVNGFGQTINTTIRDMLNNITISTTQDYDAIGQLLFKSHPNDTIGTSFQYDALGRQTRIDHPDSTSRSFEYLNHNQIVITDERSNQNTYTYRAFGNPSEKSLIRIESPEAIVTSIYRNQLDQITGVWQGEAGGLGYRRDYTYTPSYFLDSITNPETGVMLFGRDEIGNMISKQVGTSSVTTYNYDFQNRNTFIDYPNTTPDVTFGYDDNGNQIQVDNQNSARAYIYDENDNLEAELINIGQTSSRLDYTYTGLDYLDTLIYPSGRTVSYSPDALGRPNQVSPYVTNISYYPSGQTKQLVYANGQVTDYTLNNRLWVEGINVGGISQVVGLSYGYDGLGNVSGITDSINPLNDRTLGYDGVNRLISAVGQWGVGNYTYDHQGNIKTKNIGNHNLTYYYSSNRLFAVRGSTNQDFQYDNYGNKANSINPGFGTIELALIYNDASQLKTSANWNGTLPAGVSLASEYIYDGNGMRVNSINGDTTTDYVFATNGNLMREYGALPSQEKEYVYLGSQLVVEIAQEKEPAPSIPAFIDYPASSTTGDFRISWSASTGSVHRYELQESITENFASITQEYSVNEPGLDITGKAEGVYYYRLRACGLELCSDYISGNTSITIKYPPSSPGILTIPDVSRTGDYEIQWGAATGTVESYELYESITPDFASTVLIATTNQLTTSITGQTEGLYYYQVRACNSLVCSDYSQGATPVSVIYPTQLPVVVAPADITVEATGMVTSVDIGQATASDNAGSLLTTPNTTGPFTLGTHQIVWSATNTLGTSTATQTVTIIDTAIPTILTYPENKVASGNGPVAIGIGSMTAEDSTGPVTITNDAPDIFPIGDTTVTWTVTDQSGNAITTTQVVTVIYTDNEWADTSLLYATDTGKHVNVGGSTATFKNVAIGPDGELAVIFMETGWPDGARLYLKDFTKQSGWRQPMLVSKSFGGNYVNLSLNYDDTGNLLIIWQECPRCGDFNGSEKYSVKSMYIQKGENEGQIVQLPTQGHINNAKYIVAYGNTGHASVFWQEGNSQNYWISNFVAQQGWSLPIKVDFTFRDPTNPQFHPHNQSSRQIKMEVDGNGSVHLAWVDASTIDSTIWLKTFDIVNGWLPEENIETFIQPGTPIADDINTLRLAVNEQGDKIVTWNQLTEVNNYNVSVIRGNYYASGQGWVGDDVIYSYDQYTEMPYGYTYNYFKHENQLSIDNNGNVNTTWTSHVGGVWSIDYQSSTGWTNLRKTDFLIDAYYGGFSKASTKPGNQIFVGVASNGDILASQYWPNYGWEDQTVLPTTAYNSQAIKNIKTVLNDTGEGAVVWNESSRRIFIKRYAAGDVTAPVVTPPPPIEVEATTVLTTVNLGTASAVDDIDVNLSVSTTNNGPYPLGLNNVMWTAEDSAGNIGFALQTVTVTDTTPPALSVPPGVLGYNLKADMIGMAAATDIFTPVTIYNDAPPSYRDGGAFSLGDSVVTWSARDKNGNISTAAQSIYNQDTPIINVPNDIDITVTTPGDQPVDIGQATTTDLIGPLTLTNNTPAIFPVGNTIVQWKATDTNGREATVEQMVSLSLHEPSEWSAFTTIESQESNVTVDEFVGSKNGDAAVLYTSNQRQYVKIYEPGTGWSLPQEVCIDAECSGQFKSMAIDGQGNIALIASRYSSIDDLQQVWVKQYVKSSGWQSPVVLDSSDWRFGELKVNFDTQGIILATWVYMPYTAGYYSYLKMSTYSPGTGWATPEFIPIDNGISLDAYNEWADSHNLAINANGEMIILWEQQKTSIADIRVNHYTPGLGWNDLSTNLNTESGGYGCSTDGCQIVLHNDGRAFVTFSGRNGTHIVEYDKTNGWSAPDKITNKGYIEHQLVKDNLGNTWVIWNEQVRKYDDTYQYRLWAKKHDAVLGWQNDELVAYYNSPDKNSSLRDISAMSLGNGNIEIVWGYIDAGTHSIYSSVYKQDVGWLAKNLLGTGDSTVTTNMLSLKQVHAGSELLSLVNLNTRLIDSPFTTESAIQIASKPLPAVETDLEAPVIVAPANITTEATGPLTTVSLGSASANDNVDGAITAIADNTGPFAVGTHTITWSATDAAGNTGTATQTVTVTDTTAPTVTAPADIIVEADATMSTVVLGSAAANDSVDGTITATANNIGPFAVGMHTITWSATDAAGNTGTAIQTVTVTDTTAPTVIVSPGITLEATGPLTALALGTASANDLVDGAIVPVPSLVSPFTVGTHIVIWTATDAAGNMGSAAQLVTITDTTAPTVTAPAAITLEATGAMTTVDLGLAAANDLVDGSLTPIADNVGPYAVGSHTVIWSATDAAGNVGTATQTVTITDTTPPVVTAPAVTTVEASATLTTVALGTAAANDSVDGSLTATVDNVGPYAVGSHTVTWSATDAAGNVGSATQLVTVQDTTPPILTVPADVTVFSDVAIATDIGTATATDIFTPVIVTNNAPAIYPVGVTTVTWTATDAYDNVSTANQTVTVELPPGVYISIDSTSPQTVGAVVNVSAATVGATGAYEYRFRIKGPATGDVWQVLQGYSATSTYAWNTTAYAGKNRLQVQARPAGTTDTPLRSAQTFWVNNTNAAQAVDYTTDIASPQTTGAVVNISAQASGGTGSYEYQFRVKLAGAENAWVVLQDWSTLSTATWNTTGALGRHRIQVKARNVNSTDLAVKLARNYWVNSLNPATSAAIAADLTSPQTVGSTVVLTGTGTGGTGNYDYRFRIKGPATGDVWQVLQDWSASNTYNWNTTGYVGSHRVQVQLKNAGTDDRPVRKALIFDVQ